MNSARGRAIVLGAWAGYAALATIRHLIDPKEGGLPAPRLYLASGVLFSLWYLAAIPAPTLAATLAIGTDVAVLLVPYARGSQSGPINSLAGFIDTVAGYQPPAQGTSGGGKLAAS